MASTTHLSRILRTKKRLSRDNTFLDIVVISFLGLCAIMIAMFRTVTAGRDYGIVDGTIPIVAPQTTSDQKIETLGPSTPAIILTENAFYLATAGELHRDFYNPKNKFKVSHIGGRPQVNDLVDLYKKWSFAKRKSEFAFKNVILIPKGAIPMPVVIQVMALVKEKAEINNVILGTGLL